MSLFRRKPSVTLATVPYPAGRAHEVDVLTATLRFHGVELEGRAGDHRIIYADDPVEVDRFARLFWHVQRDAGWTSDLGNPERLDCEDRVTLFQAWSVMCLAKCPPKVHGGHGVMRLTVKYGATAWGEDINGAIPPNTWHQLALVAMPADPMLIDVETGATIRLTKWLAQTGVKEMRAKW